MQHLKERGPDLPHLIESRAESAPQRPFLHDVQGGALTYGETHVSVLKWAAALRKIGLKRDETLITLLPHAIEANLVWLGCAWLRSIEVPINMMYRGHMLSYVINNSQAKIAVVAERYLEALAEVAPAIENLTTVIVPDLTTEAPALPMRLIGGDEFFAGVEPADDLAGPSYCDISCIVYTSGTTGPSKGVLVPWAELYQFPAAIPKGALTEDGVLYDMLPSFHVAGKSLIYHTALCNAQMVTRESFSVSEFLDDVRNFACTTTGLIGAMAQLLMTLEEKPDDAENPLQQIQVAPLFKEIEKFEQRFGVEAFTGYGMTEIGAPFFMTKKERRDWRSCGLERAGYEIRIVDDHDEEVPEGKVGELIIRSDRPWDLNAGYFQMPERTAEAWRNGWFHTGDAFRRDDNGYFYFIDRMKDAMRRKGENISSFEIEGYVAEHPAVTEVAAIPVPSEFGPGEDEVKIVVVVCDKNDLSPQQLIEYLEPRMPRFMLPRYVEFTDQLPKTQTHRVRKIELRETPFNTLTWDREAGSYLKE